MHVKVDLTFKQSEEVAITWCVRAQGLSYQCYLSAVRHQKIAMGFSLYQYQQHGLARASYNGEIKSNKHNQTMTSKLHGS